MKSTNLNCLHLILDMDKEDALICFEEIIKDAEKEEQERLDRKKVLEKRHFRKNREKFNVSIFLLNISCLNC